MTEAIIVPTDFSDLAREALPFAADLARRVQASLVLIHVQPALAHLVGAGSPPYVDYEAAVEQQAEVEFANLLDSDLLAGLEVQTEQTRLASPAPAIVECARRYDAAFLVLSSRGRRGAARALLGSVTEEVVRSSTVPVLVLPEGASMWSEGGRVLALIDFSETSVVLLRAAAGFAALLKAQLHIGHVLEPAESAAFGDAFPEAVSPPGSEDQRAAVEAIRQTVAAAGVEIPYEEVTAIGSARQEIPAMAEELEAAVVVLGSHGRRGIARAVLGSVAESVLRTTGRPALVIRGDDG